MFALWPWLRRSRVESVDVPCDVTPTVGEASQERVLLMCYRDRGRKFVSALLTHAHFVFPGGSDNSTSALIKGDAVFPPTPF